MGCRTYPLRREHAIWGSNVRPFFFLGVGLGGGGCLFVVCLCLFGWWCLFASWYGEVCSRSVVQMKVSVGSTLVESASYWPHCLGAISPWSWDLRPSSRTSKAGDTLGVGIEGGVSDCPLSERNPGIQGSRVSSKTFK